MKYLAAPHSHNDPAVRQARFDAVCRAAAQFLKAGEMIFAPTVHSKPIADAHDLPQDYAFWSKWNAWFLVRSDEIRVLLIDGWAESVGIKDEKAIARRNEIPVTWWRETAEGWKQVPKP